jgi:hypothetical protein
LLDVINEEHRLVILLGDELKPELLLDSREEVWSGDIDTR